MKISTSYVYENVAEDVINNVRDEFIICGPGADVLKELRGIWKTKMKQQGVLNGSINNSGGPISLVRDLNVPYDSTEDHETPKAKILFPPTIFGRPVNVDGRDRVDTATCQQSRTQVGETSTPHKRCGVLASKNRTNSLFKPKSSSRITQEDGLMPDPYVDVLSTPKIYNYHGGFNEGFITVNTPAPNVLLNTPALPRKNGIAVDYDEPLLNDNAADDFKGVGRGEDQNVQHLALTQATERTRPLFLFR